MRAGALMKELARKKQIKDQENLRRDKMLLLKAFTPATLDKILKDKRGFLTDYDGKPIKLIQERTATSNFGGAPVQVDFKIADPSLTFEASKHLLKLHFQRSNTDEALQLYDAMKRQEKKKESTPSYLGVSDPNKKNKPPTTIDLAAKKVKEHNESVGKDKPSPLKIASTPLFTSHLQRESHRRTHHRRTREELRTHPRLPQDRQASRQKTRTRRTAPRSQRKHQLLGRILQSPLQ